MPLSVDMLIVAASLMLYLQSRAAERAAGLARGLPRLLLWAGIGATVTANVIPYGAPYGWLRRGDLRRCLLVPCSHGAG